MASALPESSATRRLTCARCGTGFDCKRGGCCWCAVESYRLPMPESVAAEDCICPACLRAKAAGNPE